MRYRVNDLPGVGLGAFTPLPFPNPVASSYGLVKITSTLGTVPVSTPAPTRVWAPPRSFDPKTQSSNVSPDVILPNTYVAYADNMGPEADARVNMTLRRHCPLPVPAVGFTYVPRQALRTPPRMGGRRQVVQPRSFQRFPGR